MIRVTEELLERGKSLNNGWSSDQLRCLGVPYPLQPGWRKRMIGRMVTEESVKRFLALKDKHLSPEKLQRIATRMLKRGYRPPAFNEDEPIVAKTVPMTPADIERVYGPLSAKDRKLIDDRARALVDTFSGPDGSGSHTTTCTAANCTYPKCLCT